MNKYINIEYCYIWLGIVNKTRFLLLELNGTHHRLINFNLNSLVINLRRHNKVFSSSRNLQAASCSFGRDLHDRYLNISIRYSEIFAEYECHDGLRTELRFHMAVLQMAKLYTVLVFRCVLI